MPMTTKRYRNILARIRFERTFDSDHGTQAKTKCRDRVLFIV